MASVVDQMLRDGNLEFSGGQDADGPLSMLDRNQVGFATNTTFRHGKASPRPGFVRRSLIFGDDSKASAFKTLMFQHAAFFDGTEQPMLLNSHGGRLWKTDLRTWQVSEVTPGGGRNSNKQRVGWSVQAENYWIFQDNQSYPIIFDGSGSRRSNPANKEVPVGNVMCYAHGRLSVALPDRQSFRVGDLVFGSSGTAALGYRDSILRFTENDYLNEGGDFVARVFGAPSGYGPITCMKAVAMENTQLGQGPMIVATPNMVFTVNLPFDRTTWKDLANALQTVNPIQGPLNQNGTQLVNSDIWYRAIDGIRSYIIAQRDFNADWGNTPQSAEVNGTLDRDTVNLLEFGSGALFDNRYMHTVSPVPSPMGVWHRGLVVIDFNLVSKMKKKALPAWEGIWTGLRILQVVTGTVDKNLRCFIWALNAANEIELWEMVPGQTFDHVSDRIVWTIDSPSYNCGDGFFFKKLETGEIFIDEVSGQVDMKVKYRSDQNPCWEDWDNFSVCALEQDCTIIGSYPNCPANPRPPMNLKPQFRSKLKMHQPDDDFDTINARKHRTGYEFQTRLEITGACSVKQLRIAALPEPESGHGERKVV